jgi:hypothetical protein
LKCQCFCPIKQRLGVRALPVAGERRA